MTVPERTTLLPAGIPAVGKSSFGRYLVHEHAFAHYDLECHPHGWPYPETKPLWDVSRGTFVAQLRKLHERVALDWGFPPTFLPWVRELLTAGVRLVWFTADIARARAIFVQRGGIPIADFDRQVRRIQEAGLPDVLPCIRVEALTRAGEPRHPAEILPEVFSG